METVFFRGFWECGFKTGVRDGCLGGVMGLCGHVSIWDRIVWTRDCVVGLGENWVFWRYRIPSYFDEVGNFLWRITRTYAISSGEYFLARALINLIMISSFVDYSKLMFPSDKLPSYCSRVYCITLCASTCANNFALFLHFVYCEVLSDILMRRFICVFC